MNLQSITASAVGAVNPRVSCLLKVSTGNTPGADYSQAPSYAPEVPVWAQIQSLTYRDLMQVESLNLNGTKKVIYLYGNIEGVVRQTNKGGDLITMPDGTVWLVAQVLESWGQNTSNTTERWCKVACTMQNGA